MSNRPGCQPWSTVFTAIAEAIFTSRHLRRSASGWSRLCEARRAFVFDFIHCIGNTLLIAFIQTHAGTALHGIYNIPLSLKWAAKQPMQSKSTAAVAALGRNVECKNYIDSFQSDPLPLLGKPPQNAKKTQGISCPESLFSVHFMWRIWFVFRVGNT